MKQDSSWRKILDKLLPDFLAFYFREIHQAIDFKKGFEFLDKELQKILPQEDDIGQRVVDKLVKVFLRDGSEKWLLIHIEVQGYRESDFAKRVYNCNYRISDRFGEKVISVALLTDDDPKFRENVYGISQWGFRLHFEFPIVKLIDYRDKWEELERDPNPFAIATMAFLKTVETQGRYQKRYQWKKHFLLELYRKGMSREMVLAIYEFIDIVMALPQAKNKELHEEIKQTTEEKKMSILTTAERIGMTQGVKQAISDILEIKFGMVGLELFDHVEEDADLEILEKIRLGLKRAQSIAEAKALFRTYAKGRLKMGRKSRKVART